MGAELTLERPLPQNLDAERAVLGAILLDNDALKTASELLPPSDFFLPEHRVIFTRMLALATAGVAVDLITLTDALTQRGEIERVGGAAYVASMVDGVPRVSNVEHYARIVKEKSLLRGLIHVTHAIEQQALEADEDADVILDRAESTISQLAQERVLEGTHRGRKIRCWDDIPGIAEVPNERISWLVEGLIPAGAITLIAAEPDGYKTWLAMILSKGVSAGGTFLGRKCTPANVLYLDKDNPASVVTERKEILRIQPSETLKYWGGWAEDQPPSIGDARLLEVARQRKPVIIFDSFIRFHSADENAASEIAPVMFHLRALAHAGATIVLLHHRGKEEMSKYRGSSDILAGVDVGFSLSQDREGRLIHVRAIKSRFTQEFSLSLRPDFEESGDFVVTEAPNVAREREEVERLRQIIASEPGLAQQQVTEKCGFAKGRARGLLRRYEGKWWRVEQGEHNAKHYYPLEGQAATVEITL